MSDDDFMAFIGPRKGLVGTDSIMNQPTNPPSRGHTGPSSVARINVDEISMGPRKREPVETDVAALEADIEQIGLLQPIGVRPDPERPGHYILIWGANRLAAFRNGWGRAKKLLDERGVNDEEAFLQAKIWQRIAAIVFDRDIPADYVERREISENLIRTELTPGERSIQRMRYVALVQKHGRAVAAGKARRDSQEATLSGGSSNLTDRNKPETVTSKAARDLGVSRQTLSNDAKRVEAMANAAARASGQEPVKLTPEARPEVIERAAKLADKTARIIRAEQLAGRNPRSIAPIEPSSENVIIMRLDLTDPKKAAAWFKGRLTAPDKPLTTGFLRKLAAELIAAADEADKA